MKKVVLTAVSAAAILSAGLLTPNGVMAMIPGATAANMRLAAEAVDHQQWMSAALLANEQVDPARVDGPLARQSARSHWGLSPSVPQAD